MYYLYVLESLSSKKHYIGSTNNIERRFKQHNQGKSTWTRKYLPWRLVYKEIFKTRSEAIKRENEIKKYKGGIVFKELIKNNAGLAE